MRNLTISIHEPDAIQALAGNLYRQAPNHAPRNADLIIGNFKEQFRNISSKFMDSYFLFVKPNRLYDTIETMLKNIPEFEDLNLSQAEIDKGVKVTDDRQGFTFTDAYSITDPYYDFIDLDAFVRNVVNDIKSLSDNVGTDERLPKGQYTFSCKCDCGYGLQICCEECDARVDCIYECDSKSDTCGLAIHKLILRGEDTNEQK